MNKPTFPNRDFDRHFYNTEKTIKRTFAVVLTLWVVSVLASLALLGGIVYVAWHFISKLW